MTLDTAVTPRYDKELGEMTPFEWYISDDNTQSGIVLQGSIVGSVLMTGPEPLG